MDSTPETRERIDAYREHLIQKHHREVSDYPEEVTEISTLKKLFEYAGKDRVHVRMEPGMYEIGVDNIDELWEQGEALLLFDGEHSFYDLRGVEIRIDTYLNHTRAFTQELIIAGNNLILQGLHITMVGNYPVMRKNDYNWGQTLTQSGNNNLLKGIRVISRGAYPYGYGHALMFDGVDKNKRGAVGASGRNNVFIDWEIYQRSMGHALSLGEDASHTWIDPHIEGEVRLSDDILQETAGGFYEDMNSLPEEDVNIIKNELESGKIYPLSEDAFRSYGGGKTLKILGGTIKEVRSAVFRGDYDQLFVSNTKFTRLGGALFGIRGSVEDVRIVNVEADLTCRQLFRLWGGTNRELELRLVPASDVSKFRPNKNRYGLVQGKGHKIHLKAGNGLDPGRMANKNRRYPVQIHGTDHVVRNETGLPITLTEESKNCRIVTNGEVTDNGKGNTVKKLSKQD